MQNDLRNQQKIVGPGAYALPPILGKKRMMSNLENSPAYSIGSSLRMSSVEAKPSAALDKTHKSLGSPGVGYYQPKFVLPRSPGFAPVSEERFLEPSSTKAPVKLPISHVQDIFFTKPKRFGV